MLARGYRALCCGILYHAIEDIKGNGLITSAHDRELAMDFIHSEYCQFVCDYAGVNYHKVLKKAVSLYEICTGNRHCSELC
jgi:hypothetical protein